MPTYLPSDTSKPLTPRAEAAIAWWRNWSKGRDRHYRELAQQAWELAMPGPAEGREARAVQILADRLWLEFEQFISESQWPLGCFPLALCLDFDWSSGVSRIWQELARELLARRWENAGIGATSLNPERIMVINRIHPERDWQRFRRPRDRSLRRLARDTWEASAPEPAADRLERATVALADNLRSAFESYLNEREDVGFTTELDAMPWHEIARGLLARGWKVA
jgi:hypothetical protein